MEWRPTQTLLPLSEPRFLLIDQARRKAGFLLLCQPEWTLPAPFVACPNCGARLVSVSEVPPIRLICVQCGRPVPVKPEPPLYLWLQRSARRCLVVLVLLVLPLVMISLTSGQDQPPARAERSRLGRITTGRVLQASPPHPSRSGHPVAPP